MTDTAEEDIDLDIMRARFAAGDVQGSKRTACGKCCERGCHLLFFLKITDL
jgi:hypothetical protein